MKLFLSDNSAIILIVFFILGVVSAIIYDLLHYFGKKIKIKNTKLKRIVDILTDFIFVLIIFLVFLTILFNFTSGQFRLFEFVSLFAGVITYKYAYTVAMKKKFKKA